MKKITMRLMSVMLAGGMAFGALAAEPKLKIYKGERRTDTVYNSTFYFIAVTEPGAEAWIDGEKAHVYKTGSFGRELTLKPGDNDILVKVRKGKSSTKKTVKIHYNDTPRVRKVSLPEQTVPLVTPVNIVSDKLAYLQYGNGGDRLGGSKMNFIDSGIPMTAIGQTENLYQVRLGQSHFAYIPKDAVTEGGQGALTVNTGSASVANIGRSDRMVISLPVRVPYWSRTEIDPQTIKVSLYGATNNTNWLTQRNDPGIIEFVDLQQEEADVLTAVIRLKDNYNWGYSVNYDGESSNLVIDVRHRPKSLEISDLVIGLDAGHGGKYPGAISPSGLKEKDVNLDIVLNAARMLRNMGATVVLTREGDTGPSMTERKEIWKKANVDIAVSVHNNASGNPLTPMGTSAYYKHISNRALASNLHKSMLELGLENFGLTGNFNFSLNGPTDYPNALVEVLFMSSLPEEEMLADADFRKKLAEHIVKGLVKYLEEAARN